MSLLLFFGAEVLQPGLLAAFSFSTLGLVFGSMLTTNPGDVQMPSALLRWGLLFISGVFVPLSEMAPLARAIAWLSPLTYAQDMMNHALLGSGLLDPWLDLSMLALSGLLFLWPSVEMRQRALGRREIKSEPGTSRFWSRVAKGEIESALICKLSHAPPSEPAPRGRSARTRCGSLRSASCPKNCTGRGRPSHAWSRRGRPFRRG